MKIVDAVWELRNLGKRTVEITLEKEDFYSEPGAVYAGVEAAEKDYQAEYTVVKVRTGNTQIGWELQKNGFWHVETQICTRAFYDDIKSAVEMYRPLYPNVELQAANSNEDICYVQEEIKKGIFNTDRIAIDPLFGMEVANRRYANWLGDEYARGSYVDFVVVEGERVAFVVYREEKKVHDGLLSGVFPEFACGNYGGSILYAVNKKIVENNMSVANAAFSANNPVIIALNEMFGSRVKSLVDVYTRHSECS